MTPFGMVSVILESGNAWSDGMVWMNHAPEQVRSLGLLIRGPEH